MFSLQAKQTFSFCTKQRTGGGSLSGIKLPENISTEWLEEQPQNLKLLLLGFSSHHRSSDFFSDQCFFFPGEQGLQCPFSGAAITFCRAGDSSTRHLQMQQSFCWACPIHMLCRQNGPHRFLCIARWAQRKAGSWGNVLHPQFVLCGGTDLGFYHWPCRGLLSICTQLSSDSAINCWWECVRTNNAFYFAGNE